MSFTNFKQKIYEKRLTKLSSQKNKQNEDWNEYLNKYFLNIKKVRPLIKNSQNQSQFESEYEKIKDAYDLETFNKEGMRFTKSSSEIVHFNDKKRQIGNLTEINSPFNNEIMLN